MKNYQIKSVDTDHITTISITLIIIAVRYEYNQIYK